MCTYTWTRVMRYSLRKTLSGWASVIKMSPIDGKKFAKFEILKNVNYLNSQAIYIQHIMDIYTLVHARNLNLGALLQFQNPACTQQPTALSSTLIYLFCPWQLNLPLILHFKSLFMVS